MSIEPIRYCAPCLFGVEGLLGGELRRMDAKNVAPQNGRVLFEGGREMLARANIGSRYAERIQVCMGQFTARSFDELFVGVRAMPWEQWIGKNDKFPVKGWALESALHSIPDCQSIIKKAIVERLSEKYRIKWFEETGAMYQIQFTILKDEVTMLIDTSGPGLHKRGYRAQSVTAPIKETLAAAIADLARVRFGGRVFDPCCGSGTLLIESALAALRIAPGISRNFTASSWQNISAGLWKQERQRAREMERRETEFTAWGGDIDPAALALTEQNSAKAKLADYVTTANQSLSQFTLDGDGGIVMCNPPYGERISNTEEVEALYREMGRVFVPRSGWSYFIISPHEDFEDLFGRPASKRRKLYNGMLKCNLFMYFDD